MKNWFYGFVLGGFLCMGAACAMDGSKEELWQDVLRNAVDERARQSHYGTPVDSPNNSGFATPESRPSTPNKPQINRDRFNISQFYSDSMKNSYIKTSAKVAIAAAFVYLVCRSSWGKAAWNRLKGFKNALVKRFKKSSESAQ